MVSDPTFPLVTYVVLSYNNASIITQTLDSVLLQEYANSEFIIIDDGSSDDSVAVINKWIVTKSVDCNFIVNKNNEGITRTVQKGVDLSSGDWIAMVGDDLWYPNRIAKLVNKVIFSDKNVAVVYHDCETSDADLNITEASFIAARGFEKDDPGLEENLFMTILVDRNPIAAPSAMINKRAIQDLGGYDTRLSTEDRDMFLRLTQNYSVRYVPEILVTYRRPSRPIPNRAATPKHHHDRLVMYQNIFTKSKSEVRNIIIKKILPHYLFAKKNDLYPELISFWKGAIREQYRLGWILVLLLQQDKPSFFEKIAVRIIKLA